MQHGGQRLEEMLLMWALKSVCVCAWGWWGGVDTPGRERQETADAETALRVIP